MTFVHQVTVKDDGTPSLSSTTRIVVQVDDVNDHGPMFEQKFYTVQIPASPIASPEDPLFQVKLKRIFHLGNTFATPEENSLDLSDF